MQKYIDIKGARSNNLKNVSLKIPKEKLIIMTGLSGSGKSSLAFDTIYAEGQRRYIDSLSAYARQFLGNIDKPDVDYIGGLSPAISIDQKSTHNNPRSIVGTVTEIYDYLRLLYARVGKAYCPEHNVLISAQTITQMVDKIYEYEQGSRFIIYSPIVWGQKGSHEKTIELIKKEGFSKVRIDGSVFDLTTDEINLEKNNKHNIDIVIDRIKIRDDIRSRVYDSLETALKLGDGKVTVDINGEEKVFSELLACPFCDFSIPKLEPRLFSFNSPFGACDECNGLGVLQKIDINLLVTNPEKSIRKGAIKYLKNLVDTENIEWQTFKQLADFYKIDLNKPYEELSLEEQDIILNGSKEPIKYVLHTRGNNTYQKTQYIEGVATLIERRYMQTTSNAARDYYNSYLSDFTCPKCQGKRLSKEALAVKIGGINIFEMIDLSIKDLYVFLSNLVLSENDTKIADLVLREIKSRLEFLINVGLDYLTLSRQAGSLSGGESQRIRLATQIGSKLTGVLYVLDEPSIGLHQRDNARLIKALKEMRDLGNTLIVVEHDEEIMRESDYIIDVGPYAGIHGGEIVAAGTLEEVMNNENSITGKYLSGKMKIKIPKTRRKGNGKFLTIKGARCNNLKNIDVSIPEGTLTLVTGVSGSGKSSLITEILWKAMSRKLYRSKLVPGEHDDILGIEDYERIIAIDQSPIGRTPRSNPATYTGVFDHIRDLFASTVEAKMRGYKKGRFSFNVKGGRCERCQGDGVIRIAMHFLPDVYIPCEECRGSRFNRETLDVKFKGKTIADVLDMTVDDAYIFFKNIAKIENKLKTLVDVGLGYIKLGQASTTLSGGEAQRVKLASELYKKITDKTIYLLDEPTTGLHSDDVMRLMDVIQYIVNNGATVVIIEHNLDIIKSADFVIDLGPEGGNAGGEIVASGTPEEVALNSKSYTGMYLKKILNL
ncbi:MAG: excinuclease ABC subunit UvrA [Bacilli bacterium]|jgi:excinuclease ABC subunit A|nr:excinuclease ABC subunit UvrA [Bacilli bacterium]MDD3121344.1 excinuclease ABC subunit UvrA [Bacilli bacterium]MDD4063822.1 excinuclease ABC subunit UvrA [Bacilli bacterium]MDD4482066.1 excinuclease ABC subunit UvrA [Bacilli bacterium]MDY0363105.1 excinuclease ABC subunit UvrA [Bacilli bacterium]